MPAEKARIELEQLKLAFRQTFLSDQGKKVMALLQKWCFAKKTTFVPGDPYATAMNEGSRRVLLDIEGMIRKEEERPNEAIKEGTSNE